MSETSELNAAIVELGTRRGGYFWRNNTGSVHRSGGRWLRFGLPGSGDVLGCYRGRFVSIETKTGRDKESEKQIEFCEDIKRAGGYAFFVRSIDEAIAVLDAIDEAS
jgi:hypothetical protein